MSIDWTAEIEERLREAIRVHEVLLRDHVPTIIEIGRRVADCFARGGKVLLCGNGGSAADCQHIAAELVGRFRKERKGLPAMALTTDTSALTAIANDYGYEQIFARQVEALGLKGDLLMVISTSGNSPNVLNAVQLARSMHIDTVGLTGAGGGQVRDMVDVCLCAPSLDTQRIQEMHMTVGHLLCEMAER